jgi:hypothetical protein
VAYDEVGGGTFRQGEELLFTCHMSSTNSEGAIALEAVLPDTFRENLEKTDQIIDATSELEETGKEALGPNKQWTQLLNGMYDRSQTPMATKLHPN